MTTSYHIADIRNVALAGHGASGKTSLADALLFTAGATPPAEELIILWRPAAAAAISSLAPSSAAIATRAAVKAAAHLTTRSEGHALKSSAAPTSASTRPKPKAGTA